MTLLNLFQTLHAVRTHLVTFRFSENIPSILGVHLLKLHVVKTEENAGTSPALWVNHTHTQIYTHTHTPTRYEHTLTGLHMQRMSMKRQNLFHRCSILQEQIMIIYHEIMKISQRDVALTSCFYLIHRVGLSQWQLTWMLGDNKQNKWN